MLSILGEQERTYILVRYELQAHIVHYKMARDETQHGTFSEPTRTGIHTTTQRGTVPSCIYRHGSPSKTHSVVAGGGETQQELIPFKHKEWSVVDLVLSELTVTEMGAWR